MKLIYLLVPILFLTQTLFADFSFDLYGGRSSTKKANVDIALLDYVPAITATEIVDDNSNTYGLRAVGWGIPWKGDFIYPWMGIGADLYTFQVNSNSVKIRPLVFSVSYLLRYPSKTFKPYIGFGLSSSSCDIVVTQESDLGVTLNETTNNSYGWDFSTGISWSLSRHLSLFAEYRYTYININFGDEKFYESNTKISTRLKSSHTLLGVTHFF